MRHRVQGIIIFSLLSISDPKYREFSKKIAEWTISKMQDSAGYLYSSGAASACLYGLELLLNRRFSSVLPVPGDTAGRWGPDGRPR